jgi:2-hydroxychromene-2-carboxylate isomerase
VRLSFWYDFASTYSYLAALRIDNACAQVGVTVDHRPFLLGPIFHEQLGIDDSPFNVNPVRGAYMWRDLERLTRKYNLPWRKPSVFPRHSVLAARVAIAVGPAVAEVTRAIFRASFAEDRDISNPEVLGAILEGVGRDAANDLERAQSSEVKQQLRDNTDEAKRLGMFGAPNFVIENREHELFFGNDRLNDAVRWASMGRT